MENETLTAYVIMKTFNFTVLLLKFNDGKRTDRKSHEYEWIMNGAWQLKLLKMYSKFCIILKCRQLGWRISMTVTRLHVTIMLQFTELSCAIINYLELTDVAVVKAAADVVLPLRPVPRHFVLQRRDS